LDAYDPGKEIVSRKTTQFANISEQTGTKYIKELVNKYPEGAKLAATDSNKGLIDGGQRVLSGQHILEVPRQEKPIPEAILQVARKNGVTIRETTSEANLSRRLPTRAS
jgi:predicted transcriptional regulator